jgi:MFS family permease
MRENNPGWSPSQISKGAAPIAGLANAFVFIGQGLGGLVAGAAIPNGREKWPLILVPVLFAPFLVALSIVPPGPVGFVCCMLGGISFAAMTPITISVGQRLMPDHTRLASGLMLGGAWAVAAVGPRWAEYLLQAYGVNSAIAIVGGSLVLAGLFSIGLRSKEKTLPVTAGF